MTSLARCPSCAGFVPASASTCLHCEASISARPSRVGRWLKAAGGGAVAMTMMACYGAPYDPNEPDTDSEGESITTATTGEAETDQGTTASEQDSGSTAAEASTGEGSGSSDGAASSSGGESEGSGSGGSDSSGGNGIEPAAPAHH